MLNKVSVSYFPSAVQRNYVAFTKRLCV